MTCAADFPFPYWRYGYELPEVWFFVAFIFALTGFYVWMVRG